MSAQKYALGIDFGTESGRAVLVAVADGREVASAVHRYANGVIDERLPDGGPQLEPDWALQDPNDYIEVFKNTIPAVLKASGVDPADVIGIGVDFTACTMLPTKADGTPLANLPEFRADPHAWVKLWKHHAAQPEADQINETAERLGYDFLKLYGGKISSEWFFSKALQIINEAPRIYNAADRLIEAADWVIWQLTGEESRNECTAGYKAMWEKGVGFPPNEFFAALHPDFADVVDSKMQRELTPLGGRAGTLSQQAAEWTGLNPGTPVAAANVDAHVTLPATGIAAPGVMVMIMGTSTCDILVSDQKAEVPGMCGLVEDGVVPGYYGYEAGQSGVGDIFAWFVEHGVPPVYHEEAKSRGIDLHELLEEHAAKLAPGESGLIALDWWNGNRSTLVDADLSGVLIGATIATTAPEIYRTLIEATAFGTREIIETFEASNVPIGQVVAAGGLPERNKMMMQIYADVTNREIAVVKSAQAPAVGAAMHGAVAAGEEAGGYKDIFAAAEKMGGLRDETFNPIPANVAIYDKLFADYRTLYDYFGRGGNDVMKRLRALRRNARHGAEPEPSLEETTAAAAS